MQFTVRGDKLEVTKAIKEYVESKLSKLNKYFDEASELNCKVLVRAKNNEQTVEVTVPTSRFTLRAEEKHADLYAAIDLITDKLERMIRKNKTRLSNQYKGTKDFEMLLDFEEDEVPEETEEKIAKRKDIDSKPMSEEEAILQMELSDHDFFAFKNTDEECVSVLYVRKDKSYGILNIK